MKYQISPSLMCMNLMDIRQQLAVLNRRADMLHIDIMDGHYVKNITLSPFFIEQIRPHTSLLLDVHLMVENPTDFIDPIARAGADFICPHAETINRDAFRVINQIRVLGKKVGVVLNPATPVEFIRHYLHLLDKITVMTVDPGYAGQPFIPEMLEKIRQLRDLKRQQNLSYLIEIDGSCNQRTYRDLMGAGAEVLIVGSSGLFNLDPDLETAWENDAEIIDEAQAAWGGCRHDAARWLGIDVGGTNTRLLLMDDDGEFSGYLKIATADWARQADPLVALGRLIAGYCKDRQVAQVMLGLPGILSRDRSRVLSLPFIPALDAQPVAALLADALALPVRMDKDVNHLLWWDLQQLPALPQVAVGLYLGTGMGNSLWLNGDFYHGAHGAAGELGHIPWPGHQGECPCGKRGCVESLTSGHWLTGWARANAAQTPFERLFERHGEHPDLRRFVERLAQTIAIEMNVLDPQQLILGGGVIAMSGFPLALLQPEIRRHLRGPPATRDGLKIIFSQSLTDETGSRGACLAARRHLQLSREYPQ